jgi:cyanate permease
MRMVTATLLLMAITASAEWLGPLASGLLAPIPVIAWPLAVFAHVQGGHHELGAIVRGNAIGAVGVVGFYLTVKVSILQWGAVLSITTAVLLAVAMTFVLARLLDAR